MVRRVGRSPGSDSIAAASRSVPFRRSVISTAETSKTGPVAVRLSSRRLCARSNGVKVSRFRP